MSALPDRGFKVVTFDEFKALKVSTLKPRPLVVFVDKREAFAPSRDLKNRTDDLKSRAKHDRFIDPYRKGDYEREYRGRLVRSGEALKALREIAAESRKRPVLMVREGDSPNAEILVKMAKHFMDRAVW